MELHPSMLAFFHEAVTESMQSLHVEAAESTEFYLVNLLVEFSRPANDADPESPVALQLAHAQHAAPDEKFKGLKDIGDKTLYLSGFFADSLSRKLVDAGYYMSLGESAYRQLSGMVGATRGSATELFRDIYAELAARFGTFVSVLKQIRQGMSFGAGAGNLVVLEKSGLFVVESGTKKTVH